MDCDLNTMFDPDMMTYFWITLYDLSEYWVFSFLCAIRKHTEVLAAAEVTTDMNRDEEVQLQNELQTRAVHICCFQDEQDFDLLILLDDPFS